MDDDELLDLVGQAVAADRPPAELVALAHQSRSWADIDLELAELVEDGADQLLAGVRSDDARTLVYESATGMIDVQVDGSPATISGRVDPPSVVTVERPDGSSTPASSAASAQFTVPDLAAGPARLRVESDTSAWRTGWFTL